MCSITEEDRVKQYLMLMLLEMQKGKPTFSKDFNIDENLHLVRSFIFIYMYMQVLLKSKSVNSFG